MTAEPDSEPAAVSALSRVPRMRYWRPARDLAPLISGYHLYAIAPPPGQRQRDVFQPAWPCLRFTFGEETRWQVRQPAGSWHSVGRRALFGPSSRITWSEAGAGVTIGIGFRPGGWAHFSRALAADWADRVDEPDHIFTFDISSLADSLAGLSEDDDVPKVFDRVLHASLGLGDRPAETVAAVEAALLDSELASVADLAARVGVSLRTLERLCMRAFGFAPKLLMRRSRFLRSLHALAEAPVGARATAIDPGYTDYSHFVRDAQDFLGMSPQAFLKLDTPLLRQSLELRRQVLGAPAQALAGNRAD